MHMGYKTKNQEAIIAYLNSLGGRHTTATEIAEFFLRQGNPIGTATIYRQLDRLVESGKAKKFTSDGQNSACYQYIDPDQHKNNYYHLKCENCGTLIHVQCHYLDNLQKHITDDHGFSLSTHKTLFLGLCEKCRPVHLSKEL